MKKVLFFAMFALLVMSIFVGCNNEVDTSYLDDFNILKNAVYAINPILNNWMYEGDYNTPTELSTESNYYSNFVNNSGCNGGYSFDWISGNVYNYNVTKANGSFIVTTTTDTDYDYCVALEVTKDVEVKISATDFDGDPKELTITMKKGDKITSKYDIDETTSKTEGRQTINATINGVKSVIVIKYSSKPITMTFMGDSDWMFESNGIIVNGTEIKSSMLTQSFMNNDIPNAILVEKPIII